MKRQIAIYLIFIAIILILSFGWCASHSAEKRAISEKGNLINQNLELKKRISEDSVAIYEMQQQVGSLKDAKALAESEAKNYKSLLAVVKVKVGAQVKDVEAKYIVKVDTIVDTKVDTILADNCIPVGTQFTYSDKWFYTAGTLGETNVKFDSIGFTAGTIKVIIGDKKGGLFKRKQPVVEVTVENPHFNITSANNIVVQDKRKPKRLLWFLSGLAVGFTGGVLTH